jgi:uncharacterized protein with PQ loop repeat
MYFVGFIGNSFPIIQAYKIFVNRSAVDVSLWGYLIFFWGVTSWLIYGILQRDRVLITTNSFATFSSLVCMIAILFFT